MKKQFAIILLSAWLLNGANAILGCGGCCCSKNGKSVAESSIQTDLKLCGMKDCGSSALDKSSEPSILSSGLCSGDFQKIKFFSAASDIASSKWEITSDDSIRNFAHLIKVHIDESPPYLRFAHFLI